MIHLITLSTDLIMILGTSIADTGLLMVGFGWACHGLGWLGSWVHKLGTEVEYIIWVHKLGN